MIDRGSMDKRGSMVGRGVDNRGCVICGSSSNRVGSSSFISNISDISFISVSLVVHMLDTTIRKSNSVRSSSIASTITGLSSIESSL